VRFKFLSVGSVRTNFGFTPPATLVAVCPGPRPALLKAVLDASVSDN